MVAFDGRAVRVTRIGVAATLGQDGGAGDRGIVHIAPEQAGVVTNESLMLLVVLWQPRASVPAAVMVTFCSW